MIFTQTTLAGAFVIDPERHEDERGFFARTFCRREFAALGLNTTIAQESMAFNRHKGTVRGLHFQYPQVAETKLVRCTRGALCDVIVDLRPESPTYLQHAIVELTADNGRALYVPERFAHGYQVLEDNTEASYQMNEFQTVAVASGVPYNDPRLTVPWPLPVTHVSDRDRTWPSIDAAGTELVRRMTAPTGIGAR